MKLVQRLFGIFAICAVLLINNQALAAEKQYDVIVSGGSITQEVDPDTAYINAGVSAQGKTVDAAKTESSAAVNKTLEALKAQGIAAENIKTSYYNVQPLYDYNKGKNELKGYSVSYGITVKTGDLLGLSDLVDSMLANGVNSFDGIRFAVSDKKTIERQLLAAALENAREKASIVAGAGGRNLGRLVEARIGSSGGYEYNAYTNVQLASRKSDSVDAATPILSEKIKVSVSIDATFALE